MSNTYKASRWTQGNLIFPDTISVEQDGVHYSKRRLLGSNEEVINYSHIASVRVKNGIFFSSLSIETSGGSQPVTMNGLTRGNAKALKELVQQEQASLQ